jgi:hypothetical protein
MEAKKNGKIPVDRGFTFFVFFLKFKFIWLMWFIFKYIESIFLLKNIIRHYLIHY